MTPLKQQISLIPLVENREIFIPHLHLEPSEGVIPSEFSENV